MTFSERLLTTAALAGCLHVGHGVATAQGGCTVGLSTVACPATIRTVTVAQSGSANYRYIQHALDAALPGDTILVRAGVYTEPAMLRVGGTPTAPVTLKAYPGEKPVIQPYYEGRTANVALTARWLVLEGFEIRAGRHGVVISGANNLVKDNYIHDNGQGCPGELCGQGVIVSSTNNVAVVNNRIERNGLNGQSPWHLHGIYLSNYTGQPVSKVSAIGNTIREHAGAGFQAYDPRSGITDVLLQGNTFANNAIDVIFTNVSNAALRSNTFVHVGTHPPTNAPRSTMLWLEFARNVAFDSNAFQYRAVRAYGVPTVPLHWYTTDQSMAQLRWRKNTWDAPGTGITDAALNTSVAGVAPARPTLSVSQSAVNPVLLAWTPGAGSDPTEYTVAVGLTSGGSEAATIAMGNSTNLAATAPTGTPLFVRLIARNALGATTSNEVQVRVGTQAPTPPPAPVMVAPTVTGSTVRISWQITGPNTGFTVLARTAPTGPVAASIPVSAGSTSLTVPGVSNGTYYVSVIAHNGGLTSVESAVVALTVR